MRGDRQNHTRSPCRPVTHLLSQNSPLSKMADCYKKGTWTLGTCTLISTEEAHFHGGGSFLRRRLISTKEADFHGGGLFLLWKLISTEEADFHCGGWFPLRRSISKQQAYICMENKNNLHRESKVLIRTVFVLQCAAVAPVGHRTIRWVLSYLAMNASEAGGDLAFIQTSVLFSSKCQLVSIRTTWSTQQKQWGLYQNKVISSLTASSLSQPL